MEKKEFLFVLEILELHVKFGRVTILFTTGSSTLGASGKITMTTGAGVGDSSGAIIATGGMSSTANGGAANLVAGPTSHATSTAGEVSLNGDHIQKWAFCKYRRQKSIIF